MIKILIVEDDADILTGLLDNLAMEGYTTVVARDGHEALTQVANENPTLIILDVTLPKMNGFDVCKQLKQEGNPVPIIILSARGQETDKILGLELGADDYITKPFSPRELLVRIKAVLRRVQPSIKEDDTVVFGDFNIDFKRYQVFHIKFQGKKEQKEEIKFTAAEFKILKLLVINCGEPVSRHIILREIWSEHVTTRTVDTHVWRLREKLEDDPSHPKHIITVHRIGYKFVM